MNSVSVVDVRSFLVSYLSQKLKSQGRQLENDITDDCDLLLSGIIDSLGILELTMELEKHFGLAIDFEEIDPEEMTIVGPFCQFVSEKINGG